MCNVIAPSNGLSKQMASSSCTDRDIDAQGKGPAKDEGAGRARDLSTVSGAAAPVHCLLCSVSGGACFATP